MVGTRLAGVAQHAERPEWERALQGGGGSGDDLGREGLGRRRAEPTEEGPGRLLDPRGTAVGEHLLQQEGPGGRCPRREARHPRTKATSSVMMPRRSSFGGTMKMDPMGGRAVGCGRAARLRRARSGS